MDDYIKELCDNGAEIYIIGGAIRNKIFNKRYAANIAIKDKDILACNIASDKLEMAKSSNSQARKKIKPNCVIILLDF